jgi:hypothetical protein
MTTRPAPYRHDDGSNCWTKGCSRGNFFVGTSAPMQFTLSDFYSEQPLPSIQSVSDAEYKADVDFLLGLRAEKPAPKPTAPKVASAKLPLATGASLNEHYTFRNRLPVTYDPNKHEPVRNVSSEQMMWVKPYGALWISTIEPSGTSGWDRVTEGLFASERTVQHDVHFKPEAKVLVIDSREDYERLLQEFPHYVDTSHLTDAERQFMPSGGAVSLLRRDGSAKRGLDYERMSQQYDALLLTQKGLNECGNGDYLQEENEEDVSLYIWELESAVVFNPDAVTVQARV